MGTATRGRRLRLMGNAAALGFVFVAACAAAIPEGGATAAPGAEASKGPDAGSDGDGENCPHGKLEDPHRGFVRCLEKGEADAGWLPPKPQPEPPKEPADAGPPDAPPPDAAPPPVEAGPAPVPLVTLGEPSFENGDVPKVDAALGRVAGDVGKCVAEHGGLSGASGSIKVQFLVRARARAEGVGVLASKGVSSEAEECVRVLLKNRRMGAPSADPVGVTISFELKASSK